MCSARNPSGALCPVCVFDSIRRFASLLPLVACVACSAESKAQSTLDDYEKVFNKCKDLHGEASLPPGQHGCVHATSQAVELGLKHSGLEESQWRPMLDAWLSDRGFTEYYVAPKDRG